MLYRHRELFLWDKHRRFCEDLVKNVEMKLDASGYWKENNRPLQKGKNKKVIGTMKDELGWKIMTEFLSLREKDVCI